MSASHQRRRGLCIYTDRFSVAIALAAAGVFVPIAAAEAPINRALVSAGVQVLDRPVQVAPGVELVATVANPATYTGIIGSHNVNAADSTNVEVIRSAPYSLTGSGVTVGVWEAGGGWIRDTHQEFGGRVTFGDAGGSFDDHATHVAGTIGASGVNASAKGMATAVTIRSYTASGANAEMAAAAGQIHLSNHSYGQVRGWDLLNWGSGNERSWLGDRTLGTEDANFGKYDSISRDLDTTLRANPTILSVWSAGNDRNDTSASGELFAGLYVAYFSDGTDGPGGNGAGYYRVSAAAFPLPGQDGNNGTGYDCLPQAQVAKNGLVVGAIDDITAEGPARTGAMSSFSSWGKADDGRMKPDVVGNGVGVTSSTAGSDSSYASLNGTSMAAPNVTGTMALVTERLMSKRNTTNKPLSATTKALAIHTAHDLYATGPDYQSGYGMVDGQAAVEFIDDAHAASPTSFIIEDSYNGSTWEQEFVSLGQLVKATLVWTDVAGAINTGGLDDSTRALVNDLDVWITTSDGLTTFFPWTLDPASMAAAAAQNQRNSLDNVEQVLSTFALPEGTLFKVHVGLTGSLTDGAQPWSLLLSGAAVPEPTSIAVLGLVSTLLLRRRSRLA